LLDAAETPVVAARSAIRFRFDAMNLRF